MLPVLGVGLVAGGASVLLEVVHSNVAVIKAHHQHVGVLRGNIVPVMFINTKIQSHLWMEVQTHDSAGGVAQELWVGGVLQREHTDHAWLALLVEIIWIV